MVHLLAADRWASRHPEYASSPEFFLGAISPDAIHIRDKDDKSRKDQFHLYNWRSPHLDKVLEYWRAHHAPFDIGYGIHVLTDCQWVPRYQRLLPDILLPNGLLNTQIYYVDTFLTDFKLFHETPRLSELLNLLEIAQAPSDHPLLTREEFDEWRRITIEMYRGECPKQGVVTFIDVDYINAFVEDCQPMMDQVFGEISDLV